jgi:hypothetical protein
MRPAPVGLGVNGHRPDLHAAGSADDAAGDLSAIGDEQGGQHWPGF